MNKKNGIRFEIIKKVAGTILFPFNKFENKLFVLNFHGTPLSYIKNFENQINFLKDHFTIITPDTFFELMQSNNTINESQLLLTFDDGLKNNLYAIEVLDKKNIQAIFFVVPGFINHENPKAYYIKNIRPIINVEIDNTDEDFCPMNWQELKKVSEKHIIGCHTFNHTLIAEEKNENILNYEIYESKIELEKKLEIKINSFASINNTLSSVNSRSKKIIENNYKFHFTTFAGCNFKNRNSKLIKRINMETHWEIEQCKFALTSIYHKKFANKIAQYTLL